MELASKPIVKIGDGTRRIHPLIFGIEVHVVKSSCWTIRLHGRTIKIEACAVRIWILFRRHNSIVTIWSLTIKIHYRIVRIFNSRSESLPAIVAIRRGRRDGLFGDFSVAIPTAITDLVSIEQTRVIDSSGTNEQTSFADVAHKAPHLPHPNWSRDAQLR